MGCLVKNVPASSRNTPAMNNMPPKKKKVGTAYVRKRLMATCRIMEEDTDELEESEKSTVETAFIPQSQVQ
jgi:hypothetical protein